MTVRCSSRTDRWEVRHLTLDHGFQAELDYWDTELSLRGTYPDAILNRAVPDRMDREFPWYLLPLFERLSLAFDTIPNVLDVGSGPLSMLAYGDRHGLIRLRGADPLASHYEELLRKHGHPPNCALTNSRGEALIEAFGTEVFHLVWIHNALDHSQDPGEVVRQMTGVLRTGGYLVIQGWTREGTAEQWYGLHQHDLYLGPTRLLMCESRAHPVPVCLVDGLPLEVIESSEPTSEPKRWLKLIYRKQPASA